MGLSRDDPEIHIVNPSVFQSYSYWLLNRKCSCSELDFHAEKNNICILLTPYFPTYLFWGIVGYAETVRILTDKFHEVWGFWRFYWSGHGFASSGGSICGSGNAACILIMYIINHVSIHDYSCTYYVHIMNIQIIVVIFQPPLILPGGKLVIWILDPWKLRTSQGLRNFESFQKVEKTDWKSPEI